jgi:hypothetical protein
MTKNETRLLLVLEAVAFASLVSLGLSELSGLAAQVKALELDLAPLSQAAVLDAGKRDALREEIAELETELSSRSGVVPLSALADGARRSIQGAGMKILRFSLLDAKGARGAEFVAEGSVGAFADALIGLEALPGNYSASQVLARHRDRDAVMEATIRIVEARKP